MSIGLGIAIGAAYGITAYISHRLAMRFSDRSFLNVVLGSMLLRMLLLLIVVTLCAWLLPLELMSFTIALVGSLLVSMILEVAYVLRYRSS